MRGRSSRAYVLSDGINCRKRVGVSVVSAHCSRVTMQAGAVVPLNSS